MFSTLEILGALAVAIGLIGYAFYARGILKGKVKPHAFSWLVWALLTGVAFFAQLADGGGPGAWVTGMSALLSFIFAAVGLGASSRTYITKSDWSFFIAAIVAIPIWYFTGNPLWSVIIITVIDAIAYVPTFRKAYFHPDTEDVTQYFLAGTKYLVGILALSAFSITTVLYPLSLVITNAAFVAMVFVRRNKSLN